MTVEQRELEEGGGRYANPLLEKVEAYLRAHFSEEGALANPDATRRLLMQVARDWCLNRGIRMRDEDIKATVAEGLERYLSNWKGKEAGEDTRGRQFGKPGSASAKRYSAGTV